MTGVPVRFTFTVSTELNYAMIGRRNETGGLGYSWFSQAIAWSGHAARLLPTHPFTRSPLPKRTPAVGVGLLVAYSWSLQ
eukprot:scaffold162223_cov71-Attheya_sp.AAC.1